jgi:hypothetical protein
MPLWKVYHPVGAYSAQDKTNSPKKSPQCIQGFQFRIFTS